MGRKIPIMRSLGSLIPRRSTLYGGSKTLCVHVYRVMKRGKTRDINQSSPDSSDLHLSSELKFLG